MKKLKKHRIIIFLPPQLADFANLPIKTCPFINESNRNNIGLGNQFPEGSLRPYLYFNKCMKAF